jgi:U3 small nucleolar RNA-associated protein 6
MPSDRDLWREYIKLEIGWVEALRRRWRVLGIDLAGDEEGAEKMDEDVAAGLDNDDLGANAFGSDGEQARKSIIRGDLIITVLQSAFSNPVLGKSLPFHIDLLHLLRTYPTGLRPRLLNAVYTHLEEEPSFQFNPVARKTILERTLYDSAYDPEDTKPRTSETTDDPVVLHGQELVQELGKIVKQLRKPVPGAPEGWESAWNEQVGLWLLDWAQKMSSNEDLVGPSPSPSLFLAHSLSLRSKRTSSHPSTRSSSPRRNQRNVYCVRISSL